MNSNVQIRFILLTLLVTRCHARIFPTQQADPSPVMSPSNLFRQAATESPTESIRNENQPTPPAGSPKMSFEDLTATELVNKLISSNGDVVFDNIVHSIHIDKCAVGYTNGHSLGTLYEKDPTTGRPLGWVDKTSTEEDYTPTSTHIVPDEGIILSRYEYV